MNLYGERSNASLTDKESNLPEAAELQRSEGSSVLISDPLRRGALAMLALYIGRVGPKVKPGPDRLKERARSRSA